MHARIYVLSVFNDKSLSGLLLTLLGMDLSRLAPTQLNLKPLSIPAIKVHEAISKFYFNNKLVNHQQTFKVLEVSE